MQRKKNGTLSFLVPWGDVVLYAHARRQNKNDLCRKIEMGNMTQSRLCLEDAVSHCTFHVLEGLMWREGETPFPAMATFAFGWIEIRYFVLELKTCSDMSELINQISLNVMYMESTVMMNLEAR